MKATTVINILVYVLVLLFITLLSFQWFRVKEIKPVNTNIYRINYEEIIPSATTPPPTIHVETMRPTTPAPIRTEPPQVQKNDHIASKALASSFQKLLAKNIQTGNGQSDAMLQEEKLNDVKSYSADHEYLLVLFTTEEVCDLELLLNRNQYKQLLRTFYICLISSRSILTAGVFSILQILNIFVNVRILIL